MKKLQNTNTMVLSALLAAFTCITTMVIQIPTPTFGYIHPGDTLVILSGILLGPVLGGISAGIGSMLADILSGYLIFALPTLIIKGLSAFLAGYAFLKLKKKFSSHFPAFFIGALLSEVNVVFGYFLNEIVKTLVLNNTYTSEMLTVGTVSALSGVPLNLLQGTIGIVLAAALFPLIIKLQVATPVSAKMNR